VIDDGADMRDFVINYVLKPNGYDYLEAKDGLEGFEQILQHEPDMIVLDLQMPRLDGLGLLRKMRSEGISIPVVLMTFYGSEEIVIEVFRLGVRDYVIKPFTDDELLQAIENGLMETRLRQERDSIQDQLVKVNRDLQRRVADFEMVAGVGREVAAGGDESALISRIVEVAAQVGGAEQVNFIVAEPGGMVERGTLHRDGVMLSRTPVDSQIVREAMRAGRFIVASPEVNFASGGFTVQVCIPIQGKPGGGILIRAGTEQVSDHQLNLLTMLSDYAAMVIRN
jgi:two-component system NtrC family sensor kinase